MSTQAQAPALRSRDWCELIARQCFGGKAGAADALERLVTGDAAARELAADQLLDMGPTPVRWSSTLPDTDSPIYDQYRRLGRSMTLMAALSEQIELAKPLGDAELVKNLTRAYGRALGCMVEAQKGLGIVR